MKKMGICKTIVSCSITHLLLTAPLFGQAVSYPIVDTGQTKTYNNNSEISAPQSGQSFYGQDAQFDGHQPSYTLSQDDLTVYDNVTGLSWTQSPDLENDGDIDVNDKLTFAEALTYPATLNSQTFGGYNDWRLPTMKELYSLMNFAGTDPSGPGTNDPIPFIDTDYFDFGYGDEAAGERDIDSQFWSGNAYVDFVFGNQPAAFGLNLADGRIKGYPTDWPVSKVNYVYFVRGNFSYGINDFTDNGDGTITDNATGLMWQKTDDGNTYNWQEALEYAENLELAEFLDWRLPNAKELHSLVDYSRSPSTSSSPAIDPVFDCTSISNEAGQSDYACYWTSTTHVKSNGEGNNAVYIAFGRAMGYMDNQWMDVHGAGAQRSDPKSGDPTNYPEGHGPQGDATRIYNYVRCVRDTESTTGIESQHSSASVPETFTLKQNYPNPFNPDTFISFKLTEMDKTTLMIFDTLGKTVAILVNDILPAGLYKYKWQADNMPSGTYFYKLSTGMQNHTKKMVILR